ncbi:glycosyltransferase [Campylobacter lari]|nr:glycosyltransferase [Campylobacter lari]
MKNIKLSLIIPIYNARKYLERMLRSIVKQKLLDIEIICVDDGSTDGSLDVLKKFSLLDSRIKVFVQNRKGVGSARNLGLAKAQGKYIWFVDADDWISYNSCEELYEIAEKNGADIVYFCVDYFDSIKQANVENKWFNSFNDCINKKYYNSLLDFEDYKEFIFRLSGAVWHKFILRDFIVKNKIYFSENIFLMEDRLYCFDLFLKKPKIFFTLERFYTYRANRKDNVIGRLAEDNILRLNIFHYFQEVYNRIQKQSESIEQRELLNNLFEGFILYYNQCHINFKNAYYNKVLKLMKVIKQTQELEYLHSIKSFEFCENLFKKKNIVKIVDKDILLVYFNLFNIAFFRVKKTPFIFLGKFLGIPIFTFRNRDGVLKRNFLGIPCFKKVEKLDRIYSYIFGIKYKAIESIDLKLKGLEQRLKQHNEKLLNDLKLRLKQHNENLTACFSLHQKVFSKYKDKYRKEEVVILGSGPSLNYYQYDKSKIHIGCNRIFKTMNVDYLFLFDAEGTKEYLYDLFNFKNENTKVFLGRFLRDMDYNQDQNYWFHLHNIPEKFSQVYNSESYYIGRGANTPFAREIYTDLSIFPLMDYRTVVHHAFQFALFTGSKKIYIVGCDSRLNGYYDGSQQDVKWTGDSYDHVVAGWKKFKKFIDVYYPDTEVISINPVGLRGIFKDVYTRQYVYDHPDLLNQDIEIMD